MRPRTGTESHSAKRSQKTVIVHYGSKPTKPLPNLSQLAARRSNEPVAVPVATTSTAITGHAIGNEGKYRRAKTTVDTTRVRSHRRPVKEVVYSDDDSHPYTYEEGEEDDGGGGGENGDDNELEDSAARGYDNEQKTAYTMISGTASLSPLPRSRPFTSSARSSSSPLVEQCTVNGWDAMKSRLVSSSQWVQAARNASLRCNVHLNQNFQKEATNVKVLHFRPAQFTNNKVVVQPMEAYFRELKTGTLLKHKCIVWIRRVCPFTQRGKTALLLAEADDREAEEKMPIHDTADDYDDDDDDDDGKMLSTGDWAFNVMSDGFRVWGMDVDITESVQRKSVLRALASDNPISLVALLASHSANFTVSVLNNPASARVHSRNPLPVYSVMCEAIRTDWAMLSTLHLHDPLYTAAFERALSIMYTGYHTTDYYSALGLMPNLRTVDLAVPVHPTGVSGPFYHMNGALLVDWCARKCVRSFQWSWSQANTDWTKLNPLTARPFAYDLTSWSMLFMAGILSHAHDLFTLTFQFVDGDVCASYVESCISAWCDRSSPTQFGDSRIVKYVGSNVVSEVSSKRYDELLLARACESYDQHHFDAAKERPMEKEFYRVFNDGYVKTLPELMHALLQQADAGKQTVMSFTDFYLRQEPVNASLSAYNGNASVHWSKYGEPDPTCFLSVDMLCKK
jgi:hypothetical protein